jgi:hypothetical protein
MAQLGQQAAQSAAAAGARLWHAGFRPGAWAALARRVERRAVAEVPYYRERWAAAGGGPVTPAPVSIVDLTGQLERLCPLARPWRPSREPSLWGGSTGALRTALGLAGVLDRRVPVLEVRRSLLDRHRLGPGGPPFGVLLADEADVVSPARRAALELPAAALAGQAGHALVVATPGQLPAALAWVRAALDDGDLPLTGVPRLTARAAATTPAEPDRPALLHDPQLGYFGAAVPACGAYHLDWVRYHARPTTDGGLALTALGQRRPTLLAVLPGEPGFTAVARCPRHRSPTLVR